MTEESIKVAVRVRPFNQREVAMNAKLIIRTEDKTTYIKDPKTDKETPFTFDYSYNSHNPKDTSYANQQTVFNDLGMGILENAWNGYNCSLFAYGL